MNKRAYDEAEQIRVTEEELRHLPTQEQLNETVDLLSDFGIIIRTSQLPRFGNIHEMVRWRKKKIKEELSS